MRLNLNKESAMKTEPLPPLPSTKLEHLRPDQICDEPPALFSLGNVVATPAALALIRKHGACIPQLLNRHQTGDWQELCKEDRDSNWRSAFGGERVLSDFNIGSADNPIKIWIITEWDRSYTTVLTPACY
jgi:hypothetical protein